MEDMKALNALSYTSPREAIAEKFHMSEGLLEALNPSKKFDHAGETIAVANVGKKDNKLGIGRIEIDKTRQTLKVIGPSGELIAFFPATVGSKEKPTPSRNLKDRVRRCQPKLPLQSRLPIQGVKSKEAFTIKPGPNNPAGSYWIGLSAEGYGIHGTPNPSKGG
jgi:lipoprotein-anchoring transpeptidase ErfK/SrfK